MAREKNVEVSFGNNDNLFLFIDTSKEGINAEEYDLAMNFFGIPAKTKVIHMEIADIHPKLSSKGICTMTATLIKEIKALIYNMHCTPANSCILIDQEHIDLWISIAMNIGYEYYRNYLDKNMDNKNANANLIANQQLDGLVFVSKSKYPDGTFCMYRELLRVN